MLRACWVAHSPVGLAAVRWCVSFSWRRSGGTALEGRDVSLQRDLGVTTIYVTHEQTEAMTWATLSR